MNPSFAASTVHPPNNRSTFSLAAESKKFSSESTSGKMENPSGKDKRSLATQSKKSSSDSSSTKASTPSVKAKAKTKYKPRGKGKRKNDQRTNKGKPNAVQQQQKDGPIKVAIIGGGIAGLSCAAYLTDLPSSKFIPTVFDTGRLRPGGRCSSRIPGDRPPKGKGNMDRILSRYVIDHAAQIITVPSNDGFAAFQAQVDDWEERGVLKKFPSQSVVEILPAMLPVDPGGKRWKDTGDERSDAQQLNHFRIRALNSGGDRDGTKEGPSMYYGVGGMGSVPNAIAYSDIPNPHDEDENDKPQLTTPSSPQPRFQIEQDTWISPGNGVKFTGTASSPQWIVQTNGKKYGSFDQIVIAHNGKCADRLMSKTPAKALHSTLRTNFAPTVPPSGGNKMTLNSIYSLTIAVNRGESPISQALGGDVVAAFIKNEPCLRFLTCQTRKHGEGDTLGPDDGVEVWTVLSSAQFGKKHKAPQENLSPVTVKEVTDLLLASLERSLSLPVGAIPLASILDSNLQLWGAGVPLNTWSTSTKPGGTVVAAPTGFLYDAKHGAGVCGDWCLDPSVGGAWESGRRLAGWMSGNEGGGRSVGLPPYGSFGASKSAADTAIGNVR